MQIPQSMAQTAGPPHSIALGAATGVFVAFSPLIGFHTLLAALGCWLFRANLVAVTVGTLLCNPLTFAVFLLADYHAGLLLAGEPLRDDLVLGETQLTFYYVLTDPVDAATDLWGFLSPIFKPIMLGSMILGSLSALVTYYSIRSAVDTYQRQP
jgi:uncharacterized protein